MIDASVPDLLRLVAVPVFAVAAVRDVRTRRVPNRFWYPLAALGVLLLAWEWTTVEATFRRERLVRTTLLSVGVVVPLAYGFWRLGAFGGADAKALMAIAVLLPGYPTYYLPGEALPVVVTSVGVFSLTVLTNAVLLGAVTPVALGVRNAAAGRLGGWTLVGRPVDWDTVEDRPGTLLSGPGDRSSRLDLDALRMYLRWRGCTLADLRADPGLRDPATLPAEPNDPTDGAVRTDEDRTATAPSTSTSPSTATAGGDSTTGTGTGTEADVGSGDGTGTGPATSPRADPPTGTPDEAEADGAPTVEDPWGAERFLAEIEGTAYGTTPTQLRDGLAVLVERDRVWVSPGMPFIVAVFAGLVAAFTVGDLLVGVFLLLGVA